MANLTYPQESLMESDESIDPALLNSYRNALAKNSKVFITRLKSHLIFSKIIEHLPKEDIDRIKNAGKPEELSQRLIHALMRNMSTVGLYDDFRNAVREEQPDLLPFLAEAADTDTLTRSRSMIFDMDPELNSAEEDEGQCNLDEDIERKDVLPRISIDMSESETGSDLQKKGLIQLLKECTPNTLKELALFRYMFSKADSQKVIDLLSKQLNIESITLYDHRMEEEDMAKLYSYISCLTGLRALSLSEIDVLNLCMKSLCDCLKDKAKLTYLCLNRCAISETSWSTLKVALMQLHSLETLYLNEVYLFDSGAKILGTAIGKKHKNLKNISLEGNRISDSGLTEIRLIFTDRKTLTYVSLAGNQISDDSTELVTQIISSNDGLRKLDLSGNQIGSKMATAVIKAWTENCKRGQIGGNPDYDPKLSGIKDKVVPYLNLSNNQIDTVSLRNENDKVFLNNNTIGYERAKVLSDRMNEGEEFVILKLQGIKLDDEGIHDLVEPICEHESLKELDISCNELTGACIPDLIDIYHRCRELMSIKAENNEDLPYRELRLFLVANRLAKKLKNSRNVLNMEKFNFTECKISDICHILKWYLPKVVDIGSCQIEDKQCIMLFQHLKDMKCSVEKLNLCYIPLSEDAVKEFATAYDTSMSWSEYFIYPLRYFMRSLMRVFGYPVPVCESALCRLDLENNGITKKGITVLVPSLKGNSGLLYLTLRGNEIGPAGCNAIADLIKHHSSLKYLSLAKNNIGDLGTKCIADGLKSNYKLVEIDLSGNSITSKGLDRLGRVLEKNCCILQHLDLSHNKIEVQRSKVSNFWKFCVGFSRSRHLKSLNLANNSLSDHGIGKLADVLSGHNTTLTGLDLSSNDIGKAGLEHLGKIIRAGSNLAHLNISNNSKLGNLEPRLTSLITGINQNISLSFLGLRNVGILDDALKPLARAIGRHATLTEVDVTGNEINQAMFIDEVRKYGDRVHLTSDTSKCCQLPRTLYTPFHDDLI